MSVEEMPEYKQKGMSVSVRLVHQVTIKDLCRMMDSPNAQI